MTEYIGIIVIIVTVILLIRNYFGKKYANDGCYNCSRCPKAKKCKANKEIIDKLIK